MRKDIDVDHLDHLSDARLVWLQSRYLFMLDEVVGDHLVDHVEVSRAHPLVEMASNCLVFF